MKEALKKFGLLISDLLDLQMTTSIRIFLVSGIVFFFAGIAASWGFYRGALLTAEEEFKAQLGAKENHRVLFSLNSNETYFSEEMRVKLDKAGLVGSTNGEFVPAYDVTLYGPDELLIVDGRRMVHHTKLSLRLVVLKSQAEQELLDWETPRPTAPGSQTTLFAMQTAIQEKFE